jgi:hypothetical protein
LRPTNSFEKLITVSLAIFLLSTLPISHPSHAKTSAAPIDARPSPIPSEVVWSEDFEGEINDWHLYAVNHTADPDYVIEGNFSLEGGVLRATGPEWNDASHNSSVAYGTWSFDVDIKDPENEWHFYVAFSLKHFSERDLEEERLSPGYAVGFYIPDTGQHEIRLVRGSHDLMPHALWLDTYYSDNIVGWHNLIVTHEPSGFFYVYLNGILILREKNSDYTTSERFLFATPAGPAIDNITVSDTMDYDAAPPEWDHPFQSKTITLGESFYYDLNATDYSGSTVDQYWLNDTANFAIDADGIITNIKDLVIGNYGIQVNVNDTLGNTRTGTFTLTVEAVSMIIPVEFILITTGILAVVIVLVIIWKIKK